VLDYEYMSVVVVVVGIGCLWYFTNRKCEWCGSRLTHVTRGETTRDASGHPRTFTPYQSFCLWCRKISIGTEIKGSRK